MKKKNSLRAEAAKNNGEWGAQDKTGKKITSGKRRMNSKETIRKMRNEEDWS